MDKEKIKVVCKSSRGFVTNEDGSLSYSGGDAYTFDLDEDTNLIDFKLEVADKFKCSTEAIKLYLLYPNDKNFVLISKEEDLTSLLILFADSSFAYLFVLPHYQPAQEWQHLPESHGPKSKVMDKKVKAVCKSSRGFVTNKDGSLSYSGGHAYAFDLDGDTNLSNFKLEVAGKFKCSTEAMELYILAEDNKNLALISKEEEFDSMLSLLANSTIANFFVIPCYQSDQQWQPEKHGLNANEYRMMLIQKGIFCSDFEAWEDKGVVPVATKKHIDLMLDAFLRQITNLLMRPIPLIGEDCVAFLTKFTEGGLALSGLGAAAVTSFDKLIETIKEENSQGMQLALQALTDTYIEAKNCTLEYISLSESDTKSSRLASLADGGEEASTVTGRLSSKSARKGKKKVGK